MKTQCSHCGQKFEVENSYNGAEIDCTTCGKKFVIKPLVLNPIEDTENKGFFRKAGLFDGVSCSRIISLFLFVVSMLLLLKILFVQIFHQYAVFSVEVFGDQFLDLIISVVCFAVGRKLSKTK